VQSTVGATLRKSFQRFMGTLLGVAIASLLLLWIHNRIIIDILVMLFLLLTCFFNPFTNLVNYGLVVVPLSISVVFLIALVSPEKLTSGLIFARFYDTAIGAALGVLGALFLFPNKVKSEFETSKKFLQKQLADYFAAIIDMFLHEPEASQQARAKKALVESALLSDRQFYLERAYEIHFHSSKRRLEKAFLEMSEEAAERLFSLHHMARYTLEVECKPILTILRDAGFDFFSGNSKAEPLVVSALADLETYLLHKLKTEDNLAHGFSRLASLASLHFLTTRLVHLFKKVSYGE
jgi:uncharacterized membrane protein YgaE (UPF0421/DUF939 family)